MNAKCHSLLWDLKRTSVDVDFFWLQFVTFRLRFHISGGVLGTRIHNCEWDHFLDILCCFITRFHPWFCCFCLVFLHLLHSLYSGIWSPKNQTPSSSTSNLSEIKSTPPTPPPPPASSSSVIWTPQQSPQLGRKEYRPVRFESPTPRRRIQSTSSEPPLPPWNNLTNNNFQSPNSCTNLSTPTSTVASEQDSTGSISLPGRSTSVSDKIKSNFRSK